MPSTEPAREVYLDWNSATPVLPSIVQAMAQAAPALWGNPSSTHGAGRRARDVIETTRERLATMLGTHSRDIVFTSGGTEANNLALASARCLVLSAIEHPSVLRMAERLLKQGGRVEWVPVEASGVVTPEAIASCLAQLGAESNVMVALMAVNHETGVIQPVEAVTEVVQRAGARLHVDAVQLLGKAPLSPLRGVDSIAVTAHKIRGPKGIGALAFRGGSPTPLLVGGQQERGLRPGTQDAVAALGFGLALEHAAGGPDRHRRLEPLRQRLEARLGEITDVNGSALRLPHVSNVSFRGFPGPEMVAALDLLGVRVSSGSACSAGTSEPSTVIEAMLGRERAMTAVRFSLGEETTEHEVDAAIAAVFQVLGH